MNFSNQWGNSPAPSTAPYVEPKPKHPWDDKTQDEVLLEWQRLQNVLDTAKEAEMEFRKYVISRAFPQKHEGMNTLELGNGYQLKAGVKFNYKLAENDVVEKCLDEVAKIGNEGAFIADRLVSWTPNFLLTEYRTLQEEAEKENETAKKILAAITPMLTITEAAQTLSIKEPKKKK